MWNYVGSRERVYIVKKFAFKCLVAYTFLSVSMSTQASDNFARNITEFNERLICLPSKQLRTLNY